MPAGPAGLQRFFSRFVGIFKKQRASSASQEQQLQARFQDALALHGQGQIATAQDIYQEILRVQPHHFDSLHLSGVAAIQSGNPELGIQRISKAIQINPTVAMAYNNLGTALQDVRRLDEALAAYEKALLLSADYLDACINRANVLLGLHRLDEAVAGYDRALVLNPGHAGMHNNRGIALKSLMRLDEALTSFENALARDAENANVYFNRGIVLQQLNRLDESLASYEQALALNPGYADAYTNMGNVLFDLNRLEDALVSYDEVLLLNPDSAHGYNNRANVLSAMNRFDEALASIDHALALKPDYAQAHNNRGNVLRNLGRPDDALASYDQAVALDPDYAEAYNNQGLTLQNLGMFEMALVSYDRAVELKPEYAEAYNNRGHTLNELHRPGEALADFNQALLLNPDSECWTTSFFLTKLKLCDWQSYAQYILRYTNEITATTRIFSPFQSLGLLDDPALQNKISLAYIKANYPENHTPDTIPMTRRTADGKIRIGYYSANFHDHAVAYLIAGFLESHDIDRFILYGFSFGPDVQDTMRQRLQPIFHKFVDARDISDCDVVRLSREWGIDIAIDLSGHTQDSRLGVFAHRCAPVQVNYLGYPGTIGASYMDYIIADQMVIPTQNQSHYTEKIVYLPDSYLVNDCRRYPVVRTFTREDLGLPDDGIVFCCFNGNYKINPFVFSSWMRILAQVKGSVLWLAKGNAESVLNLQNEARANGIDPARLVFAERMALLSDHLARYCEADLFLDTTPYNAHTTACDALWAGLPVLTCVGQSFAARVAASLLNAMGLPELVSDTPQQYEALAIELGCNTQRLREIRNRLERNRLVAPLFDPNLFARHMESAYAAMYDRYHRGLPPDHMYVSQQIQQIN